MHVTFLLQQMGWLGGKGVNLHPWGSRINLHKWHGLWSMLKC
jgi:hypothetical protein